MSNSRRISRPTTKKKNAISPSLIQSRSSKRDAGVAEANCDLGRPELLVRRRPRRVGPDQRQDRRGHEDDRARVLRCEERPKRRRGATADRLPSVLRLAGRRRVARARGADARRSRSTGPSPGRHRLLRSAWRRRYVPPLAGEVPTGNKFGEHRSAPRTTFRTVASGRRCDDAQVVDRERRALCPSTIRRRRAGSPRHPVPGAPPASRRSWSAATPSARSCPCATPWPGASWSSYR